jgi:5S rRNA maturation endonuclease (ribonuclease M5)
MRFRNIEFRWSKCNNKYELVRWYKNTNEGEHCYVIAFFDKDKEGYDLRTIGSRFFEDKDAFVVGKYAIEFLNETFEIERQEDELK